MLSGWGQGLSLSSNWKGVGVCTKPIMALQLPVFQALPRPPASQVPSTEVWPKFKAPSPCIDTVYTSLPLIPSPLDVRFSILVDEILFQRQFWKWSTSYMATPPYHSCSHSLLLGVQPQHFPFPWNSPHTCDGHFRKKKALNYYCYYFWGGGDKWCSLKNCAVLSWWVNY